MSEITLNICVDKKCNVFNATKLLSLKSEYSMVECGGTLEDDYIIEPFYEEVYRYIKLYHIPTRTYFTFNILYSHPWPEVFDSKMLANKIHETVENVTRNSRGLSKWMPYKETSLDAKKTQRYLKVVSVRYNDEYRTVVKFNDNSVIIMTRNSKDKFDLPTAILYAFYYKKNGYSKSEARKVLDIHYKGFCAYCPNSKIDRETYEKIFLYDEFRRCNGSFKTFHILEMEYCEALLKKMNREARKAAKKEVNK